MVVWPLCRSFFGKCIGKVMRTPMESGRPRRSEQPSRGGFASRTLTGVLKPRIPTVNLPPSFALGDVHRADVVRCARASLSVLAWTPTTDKGRPSLGQQRRELEQLAAGRELLGRDPRDPRHVVGHGRVADEGDRLAEEARHNWERGCPGRAALVRPAYIMSTWLGICPSV
jgi:hypothetical protein